MLDEMAVHSGGRLTADLEPTEERCCVTLTLA
jgi:hypothetical protein